jgi:hypothetical protein
VTNNQEAAGAAATLSDSQPRALLKDLFGQVAGCFPRREIRQAARQMADGLLMELEDYNCWSLAEAVGHRGPHRAAASAVPGGLGRPAGPGCGGGLGRLHSSMTGTRYWS